MCQELNESLTAGIYRFPTHWIPIDFPMASRGVYVAPANVSPYYRACMCCLSFLSRFYFISFEFIFLLEIVVIFSTKFLEHRILILSFLDSLNYIFNYLCIFYVLRVLQTLNTFDRKLFDRRKYHVLN